MPCEHKTQSPVQLTPNEEKKLYIDRFITALREEDYDTLETIDKNRIMETYESSCACCCECEMRLNISIQSALDGTFQRPISPTMYKYLLENDILDEQMTLRILPSLLRSSGTTSVRNESLIIILDWAITYWKEALKTFVGDSGYTFLHYAISGYSLKVEDFLLKLLEIGCDPFVENKYGQTPFVTMIVEGMDRALQLIERLYNDDPRMNVNKDENDKEHEEKMTEYATGRNNLQHLLYRFRYSKKDRVHTMVRETIRFLIRHGVNLVHLDRDGLNVTNYLYYYKYMDMFGDLFPSLPMPRSKTPINHRRPLDTYNNPSPFANLLYEHRYDKTTDLAMFKAQKLVEKYGRPTLRQFNQCAHLVQQVDLEGDPVFFDNLPFLVEDHEYSYRSISELERDFGFADTDLSRFIHPLGQNGDADADDGHLNPALVFNLLANPCRDRDVVMREEEEDVNADEDTDEVEEEDGANAGADEDAD